MLSQVKLIAEPWDLGEGGYQVGNFPVLWTEWNGKYRDTVRRFWSGDGGTVSELATRLCRQQRPVRAQRPPAVRQHQLRHRHDGFTLHDLVSYNEKHNEANGEDNRDGENNNLSWNCGVEGPTDDPADQRAARAAEAELPGDAAAVAGRADDQPRRRARPHAARQQQRLLPGQRADAGSTGISTDEQRALLRFHRRSWCSFSLRAAGAAPPQVLPGPRHPRRRRQGCRLAGARRPRDDRRGVERRLRALPRHAAGRRRDRGGGRARRADHRRHAAGAAERATRRGAVHAAAARSATSSGSGCSTRAIRTVPERRSSRAPLSARGTIGRRLQGDAAGPRAPSGRPTSAERSAADAAPEPVARGEAAATVADVGGRRRQRRRIPTSRRRLHGAGPTTAETRPTRSTPARRHRRARVPQVDGGRFPIKRTAGEPVEVAATSSPTATTSSRRAARSSTDVTRSTHERADSLMERSSVRGRDLRSIAVDGWRETPMRSSRPAPIEWRRRSPSTTSAGTSISVVAWVDRFRTWRRDLESRRRPGRSVASSCSKGRCSFATRARARRTRSAAGRRPTWLLTQADALSESTPIAERVDARARPTSSRR